MEGQGKTHAAAHETGIMSDVADEHAAYTCNNDDEKHMLSHACTDHDTSYAKLHAAGCCCKRRRTHVDGSLAGVVRKKHPSKSSIVVCRNGATD